jgi:RHS repeat-associated protein
MKRNVLRALALIVPTFIAAVGAADPTALAPTDMPSPTPPEKRAEQAGAYSINDRTGTAAYNYKFSLPPARGMGAELGLSYSSAGAIRGDVAQGWSLSPLPVIRRDVAREADTTMRFTASFGGAIDQLVAAPGDVTALGGRPYRAQLEQHFVRYEFIPQGDEFGGYWTARTTDGHVYYFGDPSFQPPGATVKMNSYWPLMRAVDAWGNQTIYIYRPVTMPGQTAIVDLVLSRIEYSSHVSNSSLQAHAAVQLDYDSPASTHCFWNNGGGTDLPVGASLDFRTGTRRVTGTMRLSSVTTQVRDPGASAWRNVRRWDLQYDLSAERCDGAASPRRQLHAIKESGWAPGQTTPTAGPTVTLTYGPQATPGAAAQPILMPPPVTLVTGKVVKALSVQDSLGETMAGVSSDSELHDMNGDGLPDLVRLNDLTSCTATWYPNRGGWFDQNEPHLLQLPRAHFERYQLPPGQISDSGSICDLGGSTEDVEYDINGNWGVCDESKAKSLALVYHWIDVDGDGKTDLVAAPVFGYLGALTDAPAPLCIKPACAWDPSQCDHIPCKQIEFDAAQNAPPIANLIIGDNPWAEDSKPPLCTGPDWLPKPPEQCTNGYVWYVFKNNGSAFDYGSGVDPWMHANAWRKWCAPVALSQLSPQRNSPSANLYQFTDVDGDHVPDIVSISFTKTKWCGTSRCAARDFCPDTDPRPDFRQRIVFNIFHGRGDGTFDDAKLWVAPFGSDPSSTQADPVSFQCGDLNNSRTMLRDMNGDGLPDVVFQHWPTGNNEVQPCGGNPAQFVVPPTAWRTLVAYNNGHGFDPDYQAYMRGTFPTGGYAVAHSTGDYVFHDRIYANDVKDVDGDGLPDLLCRADGQCRIGPPVTMDCANRNDPRPQTYGVAFGGGAGFTLPSAAADSPTISSGTAQIGRGSQVITYDPSFLASITNDWIDLDGDGIPERVFLDGDQMKAEFATRPNDSAPGLLAAVDNGRGSVTTFHYARSTDPNVVTINPAAPAWASTDYINPKLQFPAWVVKQVDVTDGRGTTSTVEYGYQDPVYAADDPSDTLDAPFLPGARFRGFQAVMTKLPQLANETANTRPALFERFTYRQNPDGLLDYKALIVAGHKQTIDQTTYVAEAMFDGVRFAHPQSTRHVECDPNGTDCDSQTTFTTAKSYGYTAYPAGAPALLFVQEVEKDTADGLSARTHIANHLILDSGPQYLVLSKRKLEQNDAGTVLARQDFFYDGSPSVDGCGAAFGSTCKGAATKIRGYRQPANQVNGDTVCSASVCDDAGKWYDAQTGNLVREVRPSKMTIVGAEMPNSGLVGSSIQYDTTYELLPVHTTNELGQSITHTFDFGTGNKLTELGPNAKSVQRCSTSFCMTLNVLEETDWSYDGLGRLISQSISRDDGANGYTIVPVKRLSYTAFPENAVFEQDLLDWGGPRWTLARHCFDGLDRPTQAQVAVDGVTLPHTCSGSPLGEERHVYFYDVRGNLSSVWDPDPRNDGASVAHSMQYDGRNRLTDVFAPDGARFNTRYAPFEKWVQDADQQVTHQAFDGFGQLRQVDEYDGAATATTRYDYDDAGRLMHVADADGNETRLAHDGEGHRIAIFRPGAHVWRYGYDADGAMQHKVDPDGRDTLYSYDDIGRMKSEAVLSLGTTGMDWATAAQLGIGSIQYIYDTNTSGDVGGYLNRIGQLAGVQMFANGQTTPYATVAYGYNPSGHATKEDWKLNLPATGQQTFSVTRSFDPAGRILIDALPNVPAALWQYDLRGKVATVATGSTNLSTYTYALAGAPRNRTAGAQTHNYDYDVRGRLMSDKFSLGNFHVNRSYTYSPDGDVRTLAIDDAMNDGTLGAVMTMGYDGLHRIRSVSTSGAPYYQAALTYSGAGNILTATVQGAQNVPARTNVPYTYGNGTNADPQAVVALGGTASFAYDKSGNMTFRQVTSSNVAFANPYTKLEYDANDQARRVTNTSTPNVWEQSFYDHSRHRFLTLRNDGSWHFYLGDEFEYDHGALYNESSGYVVANGEPIARLTACSGFCQSVTPPITLLHHDRRGDLLAAFGSDNSPQAHFTYGAFGEVLTKWEFEKDDWRRRLNGKEQDQFDQLSYYGYRYYDPLTIRWTSGDPAFRFLPEHALGEPQHLNIYGFSLQNPLRFVDPNGLQACGNPDSEACKYFKEKSAENAKSGLNRALEGVGDVLIDALSAGEWSRANAQATDPTFRAAKDATTNSVEYKTAGIATEIAMILIRRAGSRAKPKATVQVPGGGLAAHENAGGHTLSRHVGKTDAELATRLTQQPKITGASTFPDVATAEAATHANIVGSQPAINTWLNGSQPSLVIQTQTGGITGRSMPRGAPGPIDVTGVRTVLRRDPSMPTGYRIQTSFPTK